MPETNIRLVLVVSVLALPAMPALAVEAALGRTLPGIWIQPQGGVVGPNAGFSFSLLPIGYMGRIGGGRLVPVGGTIYTDVQANINTNYIVPEYVYKTETHKVSLASSFMGVVNWVGSEGSLNINDLSRAQSRSNAGVGDVVAAPLAVGIHSTENDNFAVSSWVFSPSGQFRPGNLSNLGMGEWTVMPNVAHTYLWKKRGLEFDNFIGFDIYRENATTKYTSGTMFHWDGMIIQYLSEWIGFGVIGSDLTQISRDKGPIADVHGFEGQASAVGTMALYVAKVEKPASWFNCAG